jgi:hypothetical protein
MSRTMIRACFLIVVGVLSAVPISSADSDNTVNETVSDTVKVRLDTKRAKPRVIESLTEKGIARDYRTAWSSIAHALQFNVADPLELSFTGEAKQMLKATIASQQQSGLSQRYSDQSHILEAVFYSPEGDVIELHDTVEYQQQILDGSKVIDDQHVTSHYVVLMTPSADRWVVRYLEAVPQF